MTVRSRFAFANIHSLPLIARRTLKPMAIVLLALLTLVSCLTDVEARGRGRSRAAAAAAKARKAQMIKVLQQQLAVARQILAAAESKTALSASEVSQAFGALGQLRQSAEQSQADVKEAAKTLRDIEQEIWEEQTADSQARKDVIAFEQAKQDLHDVIHRLAKVMDKAHTSADAGRLADLASLPEADRARLEADPIYKGAVQRATELGKNAGISRQQLFEKDAEWLAARDDLREAQKCAVEGQQQATSVAVGAAGDRQDLRRAGNVAAAARMTVFQLETQLRQLGVKDTTASTSTTKRK